MVECAHFSAAEINCRHCGKPPPENDAVLMFWAHMDVLRDSFGHAMPITSGYRCPEHPDELKKSGGPGPHSTGCAADVAVRGGLAWSLVQEAMIQGGFVGIGVNQRGDNRFIHLDMAPAKDGRPRPWMWSY